jgi:hypothetical protein
MTAKDVVVNSFVTQWPKGITQMEAIIIIDIF